MKEPYETEIMETPPPRKRRRWPIILLVLGLLFFAVAVFIEANIRLPDSPWTLPEAEGSGGILSEIAGFLTHSFTGGESETDTLPNVDASGRKSGVYTFLLCGTDNGGALTDTIMVASLDVQQHTMALISIPRDTYIPSASRSLKKINGAYAGKNIDRLLDEVKTVVGFRPDYWMMVDLNGFVALVDAVGGVEFDVPRDLKYSDPTQNLYIDVKKGMQHLDGETALKVARYRKGYATQDFQRSEVQRELIAALIKKALTPASIIKLPTFKSVVSENLKTDLKWGEITALAIELSKVDMDTGATFGLVPTKSKTLNKAAYQQVIKDETAELINSTVNPFTDPITSEDITA